MPVNRCGLHPRNEKVVFMMMLSEKIWNRQGLPSELAGSGTSEQEV